MLADSDQSLQLKNDVRPVVDSGSLFNLSPAAFSVLSSDKNLKVEECVFGGDVGRPQTPFSITVSLINDPLIIENVVSTGDRESSLTLSSLPLTLADSDQIFRYRRWW